MGQSASPDPAGWGPRLDRAILNRRWVRLQYEDASGRVTDRRVRPLALVLWGDAHELVAWCEKREAFRRFRLDRITGARVLSAVFPVEPGRMFEDYRGWV